MDIEDLFPPPQRLTPERQDQIRRVLLDETPPAAAPHRSRRVNRRWRVLAPAAAAAAVTAIAVTLAVTGPAGQPARRTPAQHPAAGPPTAGQVFLAAAARVAHQHPGRYWTFRTTFRFSYDHGRKMSGSTPNDQWFSREGTAWDGVTCLPGPISEVLLDKPTSRAILSPVFILGHTRLTYDLVQHWPTNATALKARIASYSHDKGDDLSALVSLEMTTPAPPGVRAAVYRAIATLPGLRYKGAVKGGHAVYIPARDGGPLLLVIDPATGLVHSETNPIDKSQTAFETFLFAQWANHLPKVVPVSQVHCPSS